VAAALVHEAVLRMLHSGMYRIDDVAVGRERVKLAGLLFSCGTRSGTGTSARAGTGAGAGTGTEAGADTLFASACEQQASLALRILLPLLDEADPDVAEARSILSFCIRTRTR
jgi:hypothetical protein